MTSTRKLGFSNPISPSTPLPLRVDVMNGWPLMKKITSYLTLHLWHEEQLACYPSSTKATELADIVSGAGTLNPEIILILFTPCMIRCRRSLTYFVNYKMSNNQLTSTVRRNILIVIFGSNVNYSTDSNYDWKQIVIKANHKIDRTNH